MLPNPMATRYEQVQEFHYLFFSPINLPWEQFKAEQAVPRFLFLQEELQEWEEATKRNDRLEQLDALVDMQYLNFGTLVAIGGKKFLETTPTLQKKNLAQLVAETEAKNIGNFTPESFATHIAHFVYTLEFMGNSLLFNMPEAFAEVHRSNMAKLWPDGQARCNGVNCPLDETRPKGKIIKPANWQPPHLMPFVNV